MRAQLSLLLTWFAASTGLKARIGAILLTAYRYQALYVVQQQVAAVFIFAVCHTAGRQYETSSRLSTNANYADIQEPFYVALRSHVRTVVQHVHCAACTAQ